MKNIYIITIMNNQNQMKSYTILAKTLASAITAAQTAAAVTIDPASTQKFGVVDLEVE